MGPLFPIALPTMQVSIGIGKYPLHSLKWVESRSCFPRNWQSVLIRDAVTAQFVSGSFKASPVGLSAS